VASRKAENSANYLQVHHSVPGSGCVQPFDDNPLDDERTAENVYLNLLAQAKEYIPDIVTATVKTAKTRNFCTPTENAQEIFENAVREALLRYDKISHYKIDGDITVSVTFYRTDMCEEALEKVKYPCVRTDARTLERVIPQGKLESLYQLVF
jgi:hypothetical protein